MPLQSSSVKLLVLLYVTLFMVAMGYAISFIPFSTTAAPKEAFSKTTDSTISIETRTPSSTRYLAPPDFNSQKALGYKPGKTFKVPNGLGFRVDFWKKIYSQYSTDQIVIHDNKSMIIYAIVDISDINRKKGIGARNRQRLKNRRINYVKNKYSKILRHIHENRKNPRKLSGESLRLFQEFKRVKGKNKFLTSSSIKYIRAQLGQKDKFIQGMFYAGQYLEQMEKIFAEQDIPMELTRIPFVESSFNIRARSKVGASGIWQFIRTTGKLFLKINNSVDERNDPIKSTYAAAKLLKQNYNTLKSWPLAVTAYNHGRGGMVQAVKRSGTKDIAWIANNYKSRTFGFASRNFYAEFLAALEVQTEYSSYLGKVKIADPVEFDTVKIQYSMSVSALERYCRIDRKVLKPLNPALSRRVWSGQRYIPQGYELRIPKGRKRQFIARLKSVPKFKKSSRRYTVRKGDTLGRIAQKHKTTVNKIQTVNKIKGTKIQVGQILIIP
ncbi:transglycosylase SLT domain-containing protein [Bdellovibrionota bacterium]